MMKESRKSLILGYFYVFNFILIELIFRVLNQFNFMDMVLIRIVLFSLCTSLLIYAISLLLPKILQILLLNLSLFTLAFIGLSQVAFKGYMNANYSFGLLISMFSRINTYAGDFVGFLKSAYFIIFIPSLLFMIFSFIHRKDEQLKLTVYSFVKLVSIILLNYVLAFSSLTWLNSKDLSISAYELFKNPYIAELSLYQLGLSQFIQQDLKSLFFSKSVIIPDVVIEEVVDVPPVIEEISFERVIDDTLWIDLMNAEENEMIKGIDAYLMSRTITQKNEYTGLFKDKNLIYIMVEAFDFMAIDEVLTPTLYRLTQEGFYFDNFFSPQYSCATGESEFIGLTSLVPRVGICSPNTYPLNTYPTSLFNLFNQANYFSSSYHNYSDKFYNRTELHLSLGSTQFYNNDDLAIKTLKGWPSDVNLMEEAFNVFGQEDRFFSYIITSSTHFPYDVDSTLGNRYLDEVSALYPDRPIEVQRYQSKAIELDHSIEVLIQLLDTQGILDETVLILYGDHFPLKTEKQILLDYGDPNLNRAEGYNINTLPMIIYNSEVQGQKISTLGSTFDLVPTIANLFDLDYDPRLYFGVDLFDETQERFVAYPSLSWNNNYGYYYASSGRFTNFDSNNPLSAEMIQAISQQVKNNSDLSYQILKNDYFSLR